MIPTRALLHRQPMIRFLGKRATPTKQDHSSHPHPESPTPDLPASFAAYRQQATQHGPLKAQQAKQSSPESAPSQPTSLPSRAQPYGRIGGHSARELGPIKPGRGEFWDRSQLPKRFHRVPFTQAEIDAIETGGASLLSSS